MRLFDEQDGERRPRESYMMQTPEKMAEVIASIDPFNRPGRIDMLTYGTNEIGTPQFAERSWIRNDTYTDRNGKQAIERRFAAGHDDYSPLYHHWEDGKYDSRCSCCYLGFSHTAEEHKQSVAKWGEK